jgi:hypothetical protein
VLGEGSNKAAVQGYDRRQEAEAATSIGAARKQIERPSIVHTSLYLPEPVYEALRKIAFEERLEIHDVVLEIDLALRRRGYPSLRASRRAKSDRTRSTSEHDAILPSATDAPRAFGYFSCFNNARGSTRSPYREQSFSALFQYASRPPSELPDSQN